MKRVLARHMIREAGMRLAPAVNARRYLYELLTGCSLRTALPPYRLSSAESQGRYNDFVLGLPASLATALAGHAADMPAQRDAEQAPQSIARHAGCG
jgi:hypothetical protein